MKSRNKSHQVISNHIVNARIGSVCALMDERSPCTDHIGSVITLHAPRCMRCTTIERLTQWKCKTENAKSCRERRRKISKFEIRCVSMHIHFTFNRRRAQANSCSGKFPCENRFRAHPLATHDAVEWMSAIRRNREKWYDSIGMTAVNWQCANESSKRVGCSFHSNREEHKVSYFWKMILFTAECGDNELSFGAFFFPNSQLFFFASGKDDAANMLSSFMPKPILILFIVGSVVTIRFRNDFFSLANELRLHLIVNWIKMGRNCSFFHYVNAASSNELPNNFAWPLLGRRERSTLLNKF